MDEAAVRALDARAGARADELARGGERVRYLGSILMREDEVVLCLFDGTAEAVRRAAEQAEVPFERILEATAAPWPSPERLNREDLPWSMRSPHRTGIALAIVAAALAAGAGRAAPTGSPWSRLSGPSQPGSQLGLARTADGVLHAIWNRGVSQTSIFETRISPAGTALGTSTVAAGFGGNGGLALLVMQDRTLGLFAAGATHPGSSAYGINTFTAPAGGGAWTLQSGAYLGGAVANASSVIGATLARDGRPVTAWRGFAAGGLLCRPRRTPTSRG